MTKFITIKNDFHSTEASVPAYTYETRTGRMVAVVHPTDLSKACRVLCGISDCTCGAIRGEATDRDGNACYLEVIGSTTEEII